MAWHTRAIHIQPTCLSCMLERTTVHHNIQTSTAVCSGGVVPHLFEKDCLLRKSNQMTTAVFVVVVRLHLVRKLFECHRCCPDFILCVIYHVFSPKFLIRTTTQLSLLDNTEVLLQLDQLLDQNLIWTKKACCCYRTPAPWQPMSCLVPQISMHPCHL